MQKRTVIDEQPIIGVKRGLWRQDDEHAHIADSAFLATKTQVRSLFEKKCAHCNHESDYNEIHHRDNDHANNSIDNLVLLCARCHQVYHLGMTAIRQSGFLALLPEIKQTDINIICTLLFSLKTQSESIKKSITRSFESADNSETQQRVQQLDHLISECDSIYAAFELRGHDTLEKTLGAGATISHIAEYLSSCDQEIYDRRSVTLKDFRIVPTINAYDEKELKTIGNKIINKGLNIMLEDWRNITTQIIDSSDNKRAFGD